MRGQDQSSMTCSASFVLFRSSIRNLAKPAIRRGGSRGHRGRDRSGPASRRRPRREPRQPACRSSRGTRADRPLAARVLGCSGPRIRPASWAPRSRRGARPRRAGPGSTGRAPGWQCAVTLSGCLVPNWHLMPCSYSSRQRIGLVELDRGLAASCPSWLIERSVCWDA